MSKDAAAQSRLDRLRSFRNYREPDRSLGHVLGPMFKQQIERPYRQLAKIVEIWQELVPADLQAGTRLDRFSRGVLHVSVVSSAHLYELDRLLRSGLQQQLAQAHKGQAIRRVRLAVDHWDLLDES